jgi:hypothetical protein
MAAMTGHETDQTVGPLDPPAASSVRAVTALRVFNSTVTAEEIAAIVAVLRCFRSPTTPMPSSPSAWSDSKGRRRRPFHHGHGAWRTSGLPN